MNGSRAKTLRKSARRYAASLGGIDQAAVIYRRFKSAWPKRRRRIAATKMHPPAQPRRSMDEQGNAARKRGAAERAERGRLYDADPWLRTEPWMSIQRLRRVAAMRKAVTS